MSQDDYLVSPFNLGGEVSGGDNVLGVVGGGDRAGKLRELLLGRGNVQVVRGKIGDGNVGGNVVGAAGQCPVVGSSQGHDEVVSARIVAVVTVRVLSLNFEVALVVRNAAREASSSGRRGGVDEAGNEGNWKGRGRRVDGASDVPLVKEVG